MYNVFNKEGKKVTVSTKEEARAIALGLANPNERKMNGIAQWSYDLGHGKCMIK